MAKIAIIGYGNVGYHFAKVLSYDHHISIYAKNPKEEVNPLDVFNPKGFDIIMLTVSDDAIKAVADSFETETAIVLHASGSRPLSDLENHQRRGVIYPLQTFSREKPVDFGNVQLFLESTPEAEDETKKIGESISSKLKFLDSTERAKIHLAAVFACNFSNHMYRIADSMLKEVNLEFNDIRSLVEETLINALELGPGKSQTGPAKRKDVSTLALHENSIEDERLKEIYRMISQSIQQFR